MMRLTMLLLPAAWLLACTPERPQAAAHAADQAQTLGSNGPHEHRAGPAELPWQLSLMASGHRSDTKLTAAITIASTLRSPLTVELLEPVAGAVVSGRTTRTLQPGASGVHELNWNVKPLAGNYRVVALQTGADAGFRAERSWPPSRVPQMQPAPEPVPTTHASGLVVRRAVRVD